MNVRLTKEAEDRLKELKDLHKDKKLLKRDWAFAASAIIAAATKDEWLEYLRPRISDEVRLKEALKDPSTRNKIMSIIAGNEEIIETLTRIK